MGEHTLDNLNLLQQVEREQTMASAGKRLSEFIEKNRATPDVIVPATEKAMECVTAGGVPKGETLDPNTIEIYEVMKAVADSFKNSGEDVDPQKIVQELLLQLPTKNASGATASKISEGTQSVLHALSGVEVKNAPELANSAPLVHGKPYSQELMEQATLKPEAQEIKPHGWSTTNAVVVVAAVSAAVVAATVIYGITSVDTKGIGNKLGQLVTLGQQRGLLPSENEITADQGRSKELRDLFNKDPFNLYKEGGWNNLFNASGATESSTILVKYDGPDWWVKLLDKYPSTGNEVTDKQIEQNRQVALEAIRKQLKENSVKDLERYRGHPNKIWTRLKDTGHTDAINSLYRVVDNPDKKDFADFTLWQKGSYDQITNRPEERDWKTPVSLLDNRQEPQVRLSTAMFLGTFAAYPGLLDEIRGMIGDNEAITVDQAQGILNNPNVRSKLNRRQFLKLAALITGSAVLRSAGF